MDEDAPTADAHYATPLAETVPLNESDDDDDMPPVAGAARDMPAARTAYVVRDNTSYYLLGSLFVVIYAHVTEGRSAASLFLPSENENPEFDF